MAPTFEESCLYGVGFLSFALLIYHFSEGRKLSHIQAVGYNNPILSYISAIKFFLNSHNFLVNVRSQYKSSIVKVPAFNGWYLVSNNQEISEEIRKLPDDVLSFQQATEESMMVKYTLGQNVAEDSYHIPIVRNELTRNLGNMFPSLHDEVIAAFQDNIPPNAEWVRYPALNSFIKIIARTSNRSFVGLPLCRNTEYLDIATNFTFDVVTVVHLSRLFPYFLRPFAAKILSKLPTRIRQAKSFLEPMINERRKSTNETPPDFLSWLMDQANEAEQTTDNLTSRVLTMNFASIHTTSITFTQALFDIAAHPEYVQPLRDEIEAAIAEEGWSKNGLDKMKKLESMIKESQRLHPLSTLTSARKVMKDHTFKDGTFVPKGAVISLSAPSMHNDHASFASPDKFDPFRFVKNEGFNTGLKDSALIPFGIGRHLCPGRHFALNSIKLLLAHLLAFYDVKLEDGQQRPADILFGATRIPNSKSAVLIRSRKPFTQTTL